VYGTLLVAAAHDLIAEASRAAAQLSVGANHRYTAFGPANVTLYQVGIAQALGDSGAAIEHAKTLNPPRSRPPSAERRAPSARDATGSTLPAPSTSGASQSSATAACSTPSGPPQPRVRYRPPVHRMTADLLRARRGTLTDLDTFARRIGMPAQ
jgi:hypothetical protein